MPVLVCCRQEQEREQRKSHFKIHKKTLSLWPSQIHVHLEGCHAYFGSIRKPDRAVTPRRFASVARLRHALFYLEASKPELALFRRCRASIFQSLRYKLLI